MNNMKPVFGATLAIIFVILGIYLVERADQSGQSTLLLVSGIACIVFFGGLLIAMLVKAVKKKQA